MMTDGYAPYNDIARRHQLVHLGCWVHLRRYFIKVKRKTAYQTKAARSPNLLATRFIKLINKPFAAETRSATWISQRRQRMRRRYSARVIQAINALMLEQAPGVVPKSLLGKGFTYLREQWPKLIRYTENGNWPISNNPCENAIRPFCVGRRECSRTPSKARTRAPVRWLRQRRPTASIPTAISPGCSGTCRWQGPLTITKRCFPGRCRSTSANPHYSTPQVLPTDSEECRSWNAYR